ncbi:unnamed protein product [Schistocephalus solidus]|uniref:C2H2-type domain-containing protein n=1 Tax=Schistocephalus solidus TaxID=70667 RepID=A0A183THQ9_SCHSO|nr:unnamed protein product [Schistocephalus solidus]
MQPKGRIPPADTSGVTNRVNWLDYPANYCSMTDKRLSTRMHEHSLAWNRQGQGRTEAITRQLNRYGISIAHKPAYSLRATLSRVKDSIPKEHQTNVIYRIPCAYCSCTYIGHTSRRLVTRITEHKLAIHRRDPLSLIFAHALELDHRFNWDGTEVVAMANTKQAPEFLDPWHSNTTSISPHVDLDSQYEGLRARLTDLRPQPNHSRLSFLDHVESHCLGTPPLTRRTTVENINNSNIGRSLHQYHVDVCCLSEVRIPDSGAREITIPGVKSHFTLYNSGRWHSSGRHGVAIALSEQGNRAPIAWEPVYDPMAYARLKGHFIKISAVSVNAPASATEQRDKEAFYSQLQELVERHPNSDLLIDVGD